MEPEETAVDRILRDLLVPSSRGNSVANVSINAGGVGLWIACACCAVMLSSLLIGAFWLSREFSRLDAKAAEQEVKLDRANTFLSAIWANAPELEKKIKSEQEKERAK